MATGTIKAIIDKTTALDNGRITPIPSSDTAIMDYLPGYYYINENTSTTVFPYNRGILEVIKADGYGLARFTRPNQNPAKIWQRTWNTATKTWYETEWVPIV